MNNFQPPVAPDPSKVPMTVEISVTLVDPQGRAHHVLGARVASPEVLDAAVQSKGGGRSGVRLRQLRSNFPDGAVRLKDPHYGNEYVLQLSDVAQHHDDSVVQVDFVYRPINGPFAV